MIRGSGKNSTNMHHKYTELFEKDLLAKHFLLIQSFLKFGDSFTNPLDVVINMIFMDVMFKNAYTSIRQAHNISQKQCLTLMQGGTGCSQLARKSLNSTIK